MPSAQREISFKRGNITGYQTIINLHASFLPGEQLLRGLALTNKFVGYNATEIRSSCLLLKEL